MKCNSVYYKVLKNWIIIALIIFIFILALYFLLGLLKQRDYLVGEIYIIKTIHDISVIYSTKSKSDALVYFKNISEKSEIAADEVSQKEFVLSTLSKIENVKVEEASVGVIWYSIIFNDSKKYTLMIEYEGGLFWGKPRNHMINMIWFERTQ